MMAHGVTADEVNSAMQAQSLILPTGSIRVGKTEYILKMNNIPADMAVLNSVPIKNVNGRVVYMSDVATVRDGYQPQTKTVRLTKGKTVRGDFTLKKAGC